MVLLQWEEYPPKVDAFVRGSVAPKKGDLDSSEFGITVFLSA
jgi:hypothetical protein